jgi:membrane protein required for colicin V production
MIIDVIFVILMILAVIKGYQRGLIVAVFSLIAFIIGLAAAMKLSTVVARYIGEAVKISDKWLPVISFIVMFILVALLVRWGANVLQRTVEIAMLGWVNRLGGIIFYAAIFITGFSVILFYAAQLKLLKPETISTSETWSFIQPWGPKAINSFARVIPYFKDMFGELETFFSNISDKIR